MKLKIRQGTLRGRPCVRAVAIIPKSKKLNTRKKQKTWIVDGCSSAADVKAMVTAAASRWYREQMTAESKTPIQIEFL